MEVGKIADPIKKEKDILIEERKDSLTGLKDDLNKTITSDKLIISENPAAHKDKTKQTTDILNNIILSDDEYKLGGMKEKDDSDVMRSRSESLDSMRSTRQFHTLSSKGALAKKYLLESKKKNEIIENERAGDELGRLVGYYLDEDEKRKTLKETKAKLERFWKYKEILEKDNFLSRTEKAKALYNYAKTFAVDVEMYRAIIGKGEAKGKRARNIDNYLSRYDILIRHFEENSDDMKELAFLDTAEVNIIDLDEDPKEEFSRILSNARQKAVRLNKHSERRAQREQGVQREYNLGQYDSTLSAKQYEGLSRTDDWLMGLGINSPKRLPFINRVLALSARERLLVYMLVETGRLAKADIADISLSQTGYVPNVTKISFKMYRVPFRLWEKAGKDGVMRHHWEMLESALNIATRPEVSHVINRFGGALQKDKDKESEKENTDIRTEIDKFKDDNLKKLSIDVVNSGEEREGLIETAIEALEAAIKARKTSDSTWWYKKEKKKIAADRAMKNAVTAVENLLEFDKGHNEKLKKLQLATGYTGESSADVAGELIGDGAAVTSEVLGVVSKLSMVPSLDVLKNDIVTPWQNAQSQGQVAEIYGIRTDDLLTGVNKVAGGATALKSTIGLLASLKGIKKTWKAVTDGNLSGLDRTFIGTRYLYGLGAASTGVWMGHTIMSYASESAKAFLNDKPELVAGMKSNLLKAGVTVSAVGLTMNVADYALQGKHQYHKHQAVKKIRDLKSSGAVRGDDATYLDGITKLDSRNKTKQFINTTFSAVSNAGSLATLFTGPAVALIWGGVSVCLSLANSVTNYLLNERSKAKTAEEFLNLNNLDEILDGVSGQVKNRLTRDKKKMKELKKTLMNHMAAELGFTTFRSFFKHIAGRYADFLFRKLFYNDADELITERDSGNSAVSQACAQLVKGMGLRVRYPKNGTIDEIKRIRPAAVSIASKLGG